MKISYVKIFGPPLLKAIKALETVAVDVPEVCIMDTQVIGFSGFDSAGIGESAIQSLFSSIGVEVPRERCAKFISKSGEKLGEYDFFFEWFKNPTPQELNSLIEKIDAALTPLGCRYTITTK